MTALATQSVHPRLAGAFYLAIILLGLSAELLIRSAIIIPDDPQQTVANIQASGLFPLAIAADTLMAVCDVALAILLYFMLKPVGSALALSAMVFRLMQAAIIGCKIMFDLSALIAVQNGGEPTRVLHDLTLAAYGYDLALIFFGVNSLITGWLVIRSDFLPSLIGGAIMVAGGVYLTGSYLRILAPDLSAAFQPAYAITIIAELTFALWLLIRGVRTIG